MSLTRLLTPPLSEIINDIYDHTRRFSLKPSVVEQALAEINQEAMKVEP